MKFHADCVACLMQSALKKANAVQDEARKLAYMCKVSELLANADPEYDSAPLMDARIIRLARTELGAESDFGATKHKYNQLLLGLYPQLKARVNAASDPIRAAVQLSMAGNYIDFNVLSDIEPEKVLKMLEEASAHEPNPEELRRMCEELRGGGELIYLHDNCGEVVLDKLLIETLREKNPELSVLSVVRGSPTVNDASMEDALEIGLAEVAEVTGNGVPDTPGTQLDLLPEALRARIERAKLVIAKGQGNFETLIGCGLNVYYLLLSKCPSYTSWYGFEHFEAILRNERRLKLKNA